MRIPYVRDDHTYKFAKGAKDLVYTLYRAYKQTAGAGDLLCLAKGKRIPLIQH